MSYHRGRWEVVDSDFDLEKQKFESFNPPQLQTLAATSVPANGIVCDVTVLAKAKGYDLKKPLSLDEIDICLCPRLGNLKFENIATNKK